MASKYLEILCTPDVLAAQERHYGRSRNVAAAAAEVDPLGPAERDFIAARDSFYLASIGQSGWPYVQHRGGTTGFLRVLGPTTIAFADYAGNRQLITTGNVAGSDRVSLFLMDYAHRRRLKLLGHARIEDVRERPDLVAVVAEP
ncbi:MAG TPA: pyridoxamine 5'-phosphate oxidase family protein, partial [Candidatus Binatia bacterium]|nr:pyridoxamine 5'-phosphate oxidase family protein [Candidatus Binatia bacterium]